MARSQAGILGAFSGKIGPVVGCIRGDVFYIRSRPGKSSVAPTPKLLASRAAFKLVQTWLAPLNPVLRLGFKGYNGRPGGLPAALGYTIRHAVGGEYPQQFIRIADVKTSVGSLPGVDDAWVTISPSGEAQFGWRHDAELDASPFDQAMPVVYNVSRGEAVYKTTGNFREAEQDTLALPSAWAGDTLHTWLAFLSADRLSRSESVYLGEVVRG